MQILVSVGTLGAFPQIGEILPLRDFVWLSCPVLTFFLDPAPKSNHWTDFYAW